VALEGAAVGQAGQRVLPGLVGQFLDGALHAVQVRGGVAGQGDGQPLGEVTLPRDLLPLLQGQARAEPGDDQSPARIGRGDVQALEEFLAQPGEFGQEIGADLLEGFRRATFRHGSPGGTGG